MTAPRLLLRPTAFVDAPFGLDGQVLRLAGGMCWFAAVEAIRIEGGRRADRQLVPVARLHGWLDALPEALAEEGRETVARLTRARAPLAIGPRTVRLDQPQVVAILNVTPDSFSDGGRFADAGAAAGTGGTMLEAGAAIVEVGGESTRPGSAPVWEGDEIARVLPVVSRLAAAGAAVAIDTRKAAVMGAAIAAGAGLVNDVSALSWDARAPGVVAAHGCPVVLMHHQGDPATMQQDPRYDDVLVEVFLWLAARIAAAEAAGIARERIVIDPGIGFGKTVRHNLALLNGLSLLHGLGCAVMLGASRKRFIGAIAGEAPADRRLGGSVAVATLAAAQGVQLHRVHDVAETVQALRLWRGLRDEALSFG